MKINTAEILCVGTELLLGEVINTNTAYIGRALAKIGISVYHTSVVGDNSDRLEAAIKNALANADLLIMSGGLGPTYDDLTKETVAKVFGLPMVRDEKILAYIEEHFTKKGKRMPENNAKQADIPLGAIALENPCGTAPGIFLEKDDKIVVLLPGPPFELNPMLDNHVIPRLRQTCSKTLVSHNLHIMGMSESELEMILRDLMMNSTNPTLAPYAKEGEVRLRIGAMAESLEEGEKMCDEMIEKIKATPVGEYIYAIDAEKIEIPLVKMLKEKGLTLSVAESCTGGLLAKRITDVPGSSSVFLGGAVTYSNKAKIDILGVKENTINLHSAVSEQVAIEMARGVKEIFGSDIAISITGEAGPVPDPATGKNVGEVFIGVVSAVKPYSISLKISPHRSRNYIREVACSQALKEIFINFCK